MYVSINSFPLLTNIFARLIWAIKKDTREILFLFFYYIQPTTGAIHTQSTRQKVCTHFFIWPCCFEVFAHHIRMQPASMHTLINHLSKHVSSTSTHLNSPFLFWCVSMHVYVCVYIYLCLCMVWIHACTKHASIWVYLKHYQTCTDSPTPIPNSSHFCHVVLCKWGTYRSFRRAKKK